MKLDRAASDAGKADGMARVAEGRERWIEKAIAQIKHLAVRSPYLCCDDLWASGLEPPDEARALGPAFLQAHRLGYIEATPHHVKTAQKKSHAAPIRVWRSRLYRGPMPFFHQKLLPSRKQP